MPVGDQGTKTMRWPAAVEAFHAASTSLSRLTAEGRRLTEQIAAQANETLSGLLHTQRH